MDLEALRQSAERLEAVLASHDAADINVAGLHKALKPLLDAAIAGTLPGPVPWNDVPGARPLLEGDLHDFPDVEQAYSDFKLQVTGSEDQFQSLRRGGP